MVLVASDAADVVSATCACVPFFSEAWDFLIVDGTSKILPDFPDLDEE